jgi:hypothetical protein
MDQQKQYCENGYTTKRIYSRLWWLTPIILAAQEAEIRSITVQSHPRQIVPQDTISKNKKTFKKRTGGVAQGVGPEFKPRYCKKKSNLYVQ